MDEHDEYKKGKKYLYDLLSRREYSQVELKRKLTEKNIPDDVMTLLVDEFIEAGYQSDYRFTESFVRGKSTKLFGPIRIKQDLFRHNIDSAMFDRAVLENEIDWLSNIIRCYEKRYGIDKPSTLQEKQKCNQYLFQRGFDAQLIAQLFKELEC